MGRLTYRAGGGFAAAFCGVFAFKECLAHFAHEFVLFGSGGEDNLFVGRVLFRIDFADGQLQAVTFVFAEGIAAAGSQPFRNHFDILEGSDLVIILVNFGGHSGGLFFVGSGADKGKFGITFLCYKTGNDVEHDKPFLSSYNHGRIVRYYCNKYPLNVNLQEGVVYTSCGHFELL